MKDKLIPPLPMSFTDVVDNLIKPVKKQGKKRDKQSTQRKPVGLKGKQN